MRKLIALFLSLTAFTVLFVPCAPAEDPAMPVPFPAQLYQAEFGSYFPAEDQASFTVVYPNASRDDLVYYLDLCACHGLYAFQREATEDSELYYLLSPGQSVQAAVSYAVNLHALTVMCTDGVSIVTDEDLEDLMAFLTSDVHFPSDATGNVFPQFYACSGGARPVQEGLASYELAFEGKNCWMELYQPTPADQLMNYCTHMVLFGFDVSAVDYTPDEENRVGPCLLQLSNGDAEVLVLYDPGDEAAAVFYKPGVSYYLLDTDQLFTALSR